MDAEDLVWFLVPFALSTIILVMTVAEMRQELHFVRKQIEKLLKTRF
jgi:hypothetical protein|tara:strand:- start:218 stop:358 length:141 start_codon:yes stop_codon:yes gene_type:complete